MGGVRLLWNARLLGITQYTECSDQILIPEAAILFHVLNIGIQTVDFHIILHTKVHLEVICGTGKVM